MFLSFCIVLSLGTCENVRKNRGFEKKKMQVTNSLSAFSLSLAVLSALWKTCIHYLSLAPETTAACLCNRHMLCFSQHIERTVVI